MMIAAPPPTPSKIQFGPRRGRQRLLRSATGFADISESEYAAARIASLDWLRKAYASTYLDAFYRTIDTEYQRFAKLSFPRDEKKQIARRVSASIRTIAAFSAWYPVMWAFLRTVVRVALVCAVAASAIVIRVQYVRHPDLGLVSTSIVIVLLSMVLLPFAFSKLDRRWPRNAVALLFATTMFVTLFEQAVIRQDTFFLDRAVLSAAFGDAVFCGLALIGLVSTQAISQKVTWQKISRFPEEEIIQSITFLLASMAKLNDQWRLPEERARIAAALEWIAQRFENDLARRYIRTSSGVNVLIATAAAERGAAIRHAKLAVAFPNAQTFETLRTFLWNALKRSATNDWEGLERTEQLPTTSRRRRLLSAISSSVGIILPLLVSAGMLLIPNIPKDYETLRNNAVITLASWSLLSVVAVLNPRRFEAQLSAAKSLGELLKK